MPLLAFLLEFDEKAVAGLVQVVDESRCDLDQKHDRGEGDQSKAAQFGHSAEPAEGFHDRRGGRKHAERSGGEHRGGGFEFKDHWSCFLAVHKERPSSSRRTGASRADFDTLIYI